VGFEQRGGRVSVRLQDGTTVEGDALIGADGVHSGIRTQLFGADKPHFTGIIAWRTIAPMDAYGEVPLGVECAWPSAALAELQPVLFAAPTAPPGEAAKMPSAPCQTGNSWHFA